MTVDNLTKPGYTEERRSRKMTNYTRSGMLDYFESMTPDSRPCRPGMCPIRAMIPWLPPERVIETDLVMVRAVDDYTRVRYGAINWHEMSAGEICEVIRTVLRDHGEVGDD
jgi:hypothetical protein